MNAMKSLKAMKGALLLPCALAALAAACADNEIGDPHPVDRLDFPVSVTADPSGRLVWVVSGNFDLAYRGAAVLAIDVLENRFVPELAFEVGNFPGPLAFLTKDGRAVAGYIASRDDDRLYSVSLAGDPVRPEVSCPDGRKASSGILHCPESGAIEKVEVEVDGEPHDLTVGADPFTTLVRPARLGGEPDLLLVAGMGNGVLATFALGDGGAPRLVGDIGLAGGLFGLVESPANGRVYASSKLASSFAVLEVGPREDPDDPEALDPVNPYLQQVATIGIPEPTSARVSDRARALAVSADGTRLYASYRGPDALLVIDISDDAAGNPRGRVLHKIAMADDPGDIAVVTDAAGDELLYVSCFRGSRIEVVDPRAGAIIASIKVGQGPSDVAIVDRPDLGVQRLYVALFNENAVGVIELDPASPSFRTEIGEIR